MNFLKVKIFEILQQKNHLIVNINFIDLKFSQQKKIAKKLKLKQNFIY